MALHRFYLPPGHCAGETLRLDNREAHHALNVLRLKHGELVSVLDGIGNEFLCTVESSNRNAVTLAVSLKNFQPPLPSPSVCSSRCRREKSSRASSRKPSSWARGGLCRC